MGNRGRFGKYGDIKRIERLRKSRVGLGGTLQKIADPLRGAPPYEKRIPKKPKVIIRPAETSDVEYIRNLSKKVFQQYGTYDDTLPRWFLSGMTVTILALVKKAPAGFAMMGRLPHEWYAPRVSELLGIAVEPERQGCGIGDLLMKEVVREARGHEIEMLILHTAVENLDGQRLFKKHGFVASEVKKNFYPEGQEALMMYRNIL